MGSAKEGFKYAGFVALRTNTLIFQTFPMFVRMTWTPVFVPLSVQSRFTSKEAIDFFFPISCVKFRPDEISNSVLSQSICPTTNILSANLK